MIVESGEQLFECLSASLGLVSTRVPEASTLGERRPDYSVVGTDGTAFYAEVKLISPNKEETEMIERGKRGEVVGTGGTPGERMRSLIDKANGQLRAVAAEGHPGVLVVFNPELFISWHTDPYCVLTAMRGLDVVPVLVPADPRQSPQFSDVRSGPKKRMTPGANTSTAAVICPVEVEVDVDDWRINVFHNRHATRALPVAALQHHAIHHWRISDDERGWNPIEDAG